MKVEPVRVALREAYKRSGGDTRAFRRAAAEMGVAMLPKVKASRYLQEGCGELVATIVLEIEAVHEESMTSLSVFSTGTGVGSLRHYTAYMIAYESAIELLMARTGFSG